MRFFQYIYLSLESATIFTLETIKNLNIFLFRLTFQKDFCARDILKIR